MNPNIENTLQEIVFNTNTAIEAWKEENTPEKIKENVFNKLNKNKEEILLKVMGFNKNWGRWELDHCNGRSGESYIGDYLRQVQQKALEEWARQIDLPKIDTKLTEILQKEILTINYDTKKFIRTYVQQRIQEVVKTEVDKILEEDLTDIFKTMKLLLGNQQNEE